MSARTLLEMTPMAPERVMFLAMLQPPFRRLAYNVQMLLQGNFPRFEEFKARLAAAKNKVSATVLMLGEIGYDTPPGYTLKAWRALPVADKDTLNQLIQAELDYSAEFLL